MGWFDEQIKTRKLSDQEVVEDSFMKLASSVLGHKAGIRIQSQRYLSKAAIDDILKYYHKKPIEVTDDITDFTDRLEHALRPYGIMYRVIHLEKGWYRDSFGPILAFDKEDDQAITLLPDVLSGYRFNDLKSGKSEKISAANEGRFKKEAFCFYQPLPLKKLKIIDLLLYMKDCIKPSDVVMMFVISLIMTGIGVLMTRITKTLTGAVLQSGQINALHAIMIFMIFASVSQKLMGIVNAQVNSRITIKTSLSVQAAVMMRVLTLPASFFRKYSSGELASRSSSVSSLCDMLLTGIFSGGLSSLTSLLYIGQIFNFAPNLVIPSLLIILITVASSVVISLIQVSLSKKRMELTAKESGLSYALLSGIQKIRVSGGEKRAFISLIGTIRLYALAFEAGLDQSTYFAFNAAYGMVMGAFSTMAGLGLNVAQMKPILDMAEPILNEVPEAAEDKEVLSRISGNIEMSHVSFRYEDNMPYVIDDLSLSIKAGDYVAIVGKTGCGKSTLIRLLLGFENPEKGAIYYDKKDLRKIDLVSLRKKIGTVTQNGDLFTGDIYSNISICAPGLSMEDAWKAAEIAGMAEDIKAMPMGMYTMITEGARDISGGQKQRLMIARAIAPKPRVLIFDEATSALDNKTQKQVSEALDKLNCTRIVIAHRLSTIRHCNRILILDKGKIVEEGTYDELINKNGFFAELVERQRLEKTEDRKEENTGHE